MTSTKTDGSTTPTYKPRRWVGNSIRIHHWWWGTLTRRWHVALRSPLSPGQIFLPPGVRPPETLPDDLQECSEVDWLDDAPEVPEAPDELTVMRERAEKAEAKVAELRTSEQSRLSETAGEAPPFTIFRFIDRGFGDSCYLVHADGRHLPVFHIRDNVWGQWSSKEPSACKWPEGRIAVQVCNARGLKIAADQRGREAS